MGMDRTKPNIPRGQVGFIDYIVKPLFEKWNNLFTNVTQICLDNLMENKKNWTDAIHSDPNANNVNITLNNLNKQRKSKPIQINEPILYQNNDSNKSNNNEYHAVIVTKKVKNKTNKKKKKKK